MVQKLFIIEQLHWIWVELPLLVISTFVVPLRFMEPLVEVL